MEIRPRVGSPRITLAWGSRGLGNSLVSLKHRPPHGAVAFGAAEFFSRPLAPHSGHRGRVLREDRPLREDTAINSGRGGDERILDPAPLFSGSGVARAS
jgi:hypothetical protein